jgi:hypothetical protein
VCNCPGRIDPAAQAIRTAWREKEQVIMPSIPQSLLWISLVVLWLFVLVPMLISKRDAVRRTSDVALATRVLNGDTNSRLIRRSGPAAGHRSDPDWKPAAEGEFAEADGDLLVAQEHEEDPDTDEMPSRSPVVVKVAVSAPAEPDYLDVDVIEDSGALPVGESGQVTEPVLVALAESEAAGETARVVSEEDEQDLDDLGDRYEYIEDSSGVEPEADEFQDDDSTGPVAPAASRRRRFDTKKAAAVSARKYAFRKRMLMIQAVVLVGTATLAFEVTPTAWWLCSSAIVFTMLYLAYLRRQTRIEEKVRRRRVQRMARARLGVENARDREYEVVPSRLRRPGAVVLEIDDEDPIFEHLENAMAMRTFGWPRDMPRAVGE